MLIELQSIKKCYPNGKTNQKITVLNGVNLTVMEGELVAIKGASGAGKSTLLHILGCLDKPSDGCYLLNGVNVKNKTSIELSIIRNKTFGFVMQHFALIEEDTVLQNVSTPLLFAKRSFAQMDKVAMQNLHALGIEDLANKQVSRLSGGEKQRVAIARALVNNPSILLADEPTGSLDTKNTTMIMDVFKELNEQGKTIIIVTHEDYIAQSCHRIITISDGRIIKDINSNWDASFQL